MSFFGRLEEACAAFIERAFAATFPSRIEPAQIARKLVATMQARTIVETSGRAAPNLYTVRVNPEDHRRLAAFTGYLQEQWTALLEEMAQSAGVHFPFPPQVALLADSNVVLGAVDISAEMGAAAQNDAQHWILCVVRGVSASPFYDVRRTVTLGRGDENDIVIADPRVSRRHARIALEDGVAVIEDLQSSNGTFVNGAPIERRTLAAGDTIVLGESELRLERSDAHT